jgi:activator of HSP90 ATPase
MAAKKKNKRAKPASKKKSAMKKKAPKRKAAAKHKKLVHAKRAAPKTKAPRAPSNGVVEIATIVQEEIFDAAPMDVYEALVEPARHAAFTGSTATGEPVEGGAFTAWDGYIMGRHERLVPGARIVQLWRTSEFPLAHPDSRLELELRPEPEGRTRLRMTHSGVPKSQAKGYEKGWVDRYWMPLRDYLQETD